MRSWKKNLLKTKWHFITVVSIIFCVVYLLMLAFLPAYTDGFIGAYLVFILTFSWLYGRFKKVQLQRTEKPIDNLTTLMMHDRALTMWLGASLCLLLAVLVVIIFPAQFNIFLLAPTAIIVGLAAGYVIHTALRKSSSAA